jgi:hypothetical protein
VGTNMRISFGAGADRGGSEGRVSRHEAARRCGFCRLRLPTSQSGFQVIIDRIFVDRGAHGKLRSDVRRIKPFLNMATVLPSSSFVTDRSGSLLVLGGQWGHRILSQTPQHWYDRRKIPGYIICGQFKVGLKLYSCRIEKRAEVLFDKIFEPRLCVS